MSVVTVVLQGCASIVHVEGQVTGSTAAVTMSVSLEMVIIVATGCLGLWLVAGARVGQECDCSRGRFVAMETAGDLQVSGNHSVGSWRRSASGIDLVLWWR